MLVRLRKILVKRGCLSGKIINATPSLPSMTTYKQHFGNLRTLYRLVGYTNTSYWGDLEAYQRWADLKRTNGALLCDAFEKPGARATFDPSIGLLRVNDTVNICLELAKCRKYEGFGVEMDSTPPNATASGWTVAIRLGENNKAILDYVLLRSPSVAGQWLWF